MDSLANKSTVVVTACGRNTYQLSIVSAQQQLKDQLENKEEEYDSGTENQNTGMDTDFDKELFSDDEETTITRRHHHRHEHHHHHHEHHAQLTVKGESGTRVHGRIVHLPPSCCRTSIAAMEATDVGKIIQLSGTCVRTGPVPMYESARTYQCIGKKGCGRCFIQYADLEERNNAMVVPDRCTLFLENGMRCSGTNLQ
jgi:DNA replicative helicase MCM subunit Mcm2 (Cdc46/Mcm family)